MADYLPPVVTKLTGDIDDFLAKLAQAEAAMREFADHVEAIPVRFNIDEASVAKVEAIAKALGDTLRPEINVQTNIGTLNMLEEAVTRVSNAEGDAAKNAYLWAMAQRMQQNAAKDAAGGGTAAGAGAAGWGMWGAFAGTTTLWQGTPWAHPLSNLHIALDAGVDAAIALGSALIDLGAGLAAMAPAAQDIYTRLNSVHDVSVALQQTIPPLNGWFEQMQHAVAPATVEAFGGALALVNRETGGLTPIIKNVTGGIDDWIAKLDVYLGKQGNFSTLLSNGTGYLHQFAVAVDNIGMSMVNLVHAEPGTVHFLLDFLDAGTGLLNLLTRLPSWILEGALAFHSFYIYGGLAWNVLRSMTLPMVTVGQGILASAANFGIFGTKAQAAVIPMNDLRTAEAGAAVGATTLNDRLIALATSPWTWAIVGAAAIAGLVYEMQQADPASQNLINNINNTLSTDTASQSIMDITRSLGSLQNQIDFMSSPSGITALKANWADLANTGTSFANDMKAEGHDIAKTFTDLFTGGFGASFGDTLKSVKDLFVPGAGATDEAAQSVAKLRSEINGLLGEQKNEYQVIGQVMQGQLGATGATYSYTQSLAILDLAGVKATDKLADMQQKVANLLNGYRAMSVSGDLLGNSINAVTFAAEQQNSQVNALTQGWTAFMALVTGGESDFTNFEQQVYGVEQALTQSTDTLSLSNGKVSASTALAGKAAAGTTVDINGLSSASLQLRSAFTTSITNASQLENQLIMMASASGLGAKGTQLLTQAGKDMAAQLLPMAKNSQIAQDELYGLAQQAGYHGVNSFQALSKWVGNVQNPMSDLDSIVTRLTGDSATLANDVSNLANALNQNLNQAMATAISQASPGGQTAFNNFAAAALNAHGNISGLASAATPLGKELLTMTGNASSAQAEFEVFAGWLGISKDKADSLWQMIQNNLTPAMDNIPNVDRTITVSTVFQTTGTPPTGYVGPGSQSIFTNYAAHAAGYRVPGYGGGDRWPALLEGGEAVVPKELTPGVAPFLSAHGVPGFASGGYAGGNYYPPDAEPIVVEVYLDGKQIQKTVQQKTYRSNRRNGIKTTGRMSPN